MSKRWKWQWWKKMGSKKSCEHVKNVSDQSLRELWLIFILDQGAGQMTIIPWALKNLLTRRLVLSFLDIQLIWLAYCRWCSHRRLCWTRWGSGSSWWSGPARSTWCGPQGRAESPGSAGCCWWFWPVGSSIESVMGVAVQLELNQTRAAEMLGQKRNRTVYGQP